MDLTVGAVVVAALATLLGATIQGSIGFGMNLVTVPVLALVLPESLPGAVLVLGLPISLAMLRHERAELDRAGIAWLVAGRLPGTLVGAWIVASVTAATLQGVVGSIVLLLVVASLVMPPIPVQRATQAAVGLVSGITGTAAGIGGPPVAMLYQRHPGPAMRSTLAASFSAGIVMSIVALTISGEMTWGHVALGAGLAPVVLAGTTLGRRSHGLLEGGWLRPAVLAFSALSALVVLFDALR